MQILQCFGLNNNVASIIDEHRENNLNLRVGAQRKAEPVLCGTVVYGQAR